MIEQTFDVGFGHLARLCMDCPIWYFWSFRL